MKRHILPLLAVGVLLIAACSRDEANKTQAENLQKFEKAFELSEQATSGVVYKQGPVPAEGEPVTPGPDAEAYRQEKQTAAAELLDQLRVSGEASQRAAAKLLISETQASAARAANRKASLAWAELTPLMSTLITDASALNLNSQLAAEYGKVNFEKALAEARQSLNDRTGEQQELTKSVESIRKKIQSFQAQLDQYAQTHRSRITDSESLSRRAFTAKGRLRYDLYVQAALAAKEADNATAKSDLVRAEMDAEEAKLKVEQTHLNGANELVKALDETVKSLLERATRTAELAQAADARATEHARQFDESFVRLMSVRGDTIDPSFADAVEKMTQAIESAEAAASAATGTTRGDLELYALSMKADLGHLLRQRAAVDTAYRDTMQALIAIMEGQAGDRVDKAREAAEAAGTRVKEAQDQASAAFNAVAEELDKLAEAAKTGGDKNAESVVLKHLITVNLALSAVTGDEQFKTKAEQQSQRLQELAGS